MSGVAMAMVDEMMTVEEYKMAPVEISPMISVMLTVNLWTLGNIFIPLMKIQPLIFLEQPGSSENMYALLRASLGSIIAPTLPLNIALVLLKQTLLSHNMMKPPPQKATLIHLQLLHAITKGNNKVIKILMPFNGMVYTDIWLLAQLILLTLEELFPFAMTMKMHN